MLLYQGLLLGPATDLVCFGIEFGFCGLGGNLDLGHSMIFFHRRVSSRREDGRVACGRSEPEIWGVVPG